MFLERFIENLTVNFGSIDATAHIDLCVLARQDESDQRKSPVYHWQNEPFFFWWVHRTARGDSIYDLSHGFSPWLAPSSAQAG